MPSNVRFAEVRRILENAGYELARISGSHHIFSKAGASPVSVPVHNGLVKYGYVRRIQKIIDAEQANEEGREAGDEAGPVQDGDLESGTESGK